MAVEQAGDVSDDRAILDNYEYAEGTQCSEFQLIKLYRSRIIFFKITYKSSLNQWALEERFELISLIIWRELSD